jgi:hypothetical protein
MTGMGEAMAPASRAKRGDFSRRVFRGAGVALSISALLAACGGEPEDPQAPAGQGAPMLRDAGAEATAPVPGSDYWAAFLDEVVAGDLAAARAGYERELDRGADAPAVAARAALRLAELEGAAGNRRRALELVARATAVAYDDEAVQDAAERLRGRLVAAPSGAGDLRGPPAGTALPGVAAETAAAFAAAEATLARVHRIRLEPVLEALSSTVRAKERATEAAARAYRAVADAGGLARIAAQYRVGSLYHDLAIELVFDLPPELEAGVASRLRRTLRASAVAYLRKAAAAYRVSLAEPVGGSADDAALWRSAAQSDLRAAEELLGDR